VPLCTLSLKLSRGAAAPALERSKNAAVSGGDDEGQEDTLARRVHKKLLVECISAHGGHLPEDGLGKKVVVAKEAVSYDVQRRCIKGEGLHKRTLMHNCVLIPMHP